MKRTLVVSGAGAAREGFAWPRAEAAATGPGAQEIAAGMIVSGFHPFPPLRCERLSMK
jgi:hypothetical protein